MPYKELVYKAAKITYTEKEFWGAWFMEGITSQGDFKWNSSLLRDKEICFWEQVNIDDDKIHDYEIRQSNLNYLES